MKKYMVLGASPNSTRHSNKAVKSLIRRSMDVVPVGTRMGDVLDVPILTGKPEIENIDTILLYVGAKRQADYSAYIKALEPKQVIFNPGTENIEFQEELAGKGIEVVVGCALVMINAGQL